MMIGNHLNVWWHQIIENQQQNFRLCLIVKVKAFPHTQCEEGIGTKPLISEANQKKRLQFSRELKDLTLEQWKRGNVVWWVQNLVMVHQGTSCSFIHTSNNTKTMLIRENQSYWTNCASIINLCLSHSLFSVIIKNPNIKIL